MVGRYIPSDAFLRRSTSDASRRKLICFFIPVVMTRIDSACNRVYKAAENVFRTKETPENTKGPAMFTRLRTVFACWLLGHRRFPETGRYCYRCGNK
jgi:hypothetical protein